MNIVNTCLLLMILSLVVYTKQTWSMKYKNGSAVPVENLERLIFHYGRSTVHGALQLRCVGGRAHHVGYHFRTVICENRSLGAAFSKITWECKGVKGPLTYYRIGSFMLKCAGNDEGIVLVKTCRLKYTLEYSVRLIIVHACIAVASLWLILGASLYGFLKLSGKTSNEDERKDEVSGDETDQGSLSELNAIRHNFSSGRKIIVYGSFGSLKSYQSLPSTPASRNSVEVVESDTSISDVDVDIFYTDFC